MNSIIRCEYERLETLVKFKNQNEVLLKENSLTWQMLTDAEGYYNRLSDLLVEEDKYEKVATDEKEKTFKKLEKEGARLAGLLTSYGNYKDFSPFKNLVGCSKSELARARDIVKIKNLKTMYSVMVDEAETSNEAGITAEEMTSFEGLLKKAEEIENQPLKYRQMQSNIIDKEEKEVEGFKNLLHNVLKPNMDANFAESNSDLYRQFLDSIHVDATRKRKRVLTGSMKNKKGEPVKKVMISIDGQKAVKRGGKNGQFFFYNITPGKHTIQLKKDSYEDIVKVFVLEADKVLQLDFVFELIKVETS